MGIPSTQFLVTQAHHDLIALFADFELLVAKRRVTDDLGRRGLREGEFLLVGSDPLLDFRFHGGLVLEVAFRGRALDFLMRALPVVKGHPMRNAIADFLEVSLSLGLVVPLFFQTAPERLDFSIPLGRARPDVVDVFSLEEFLEQRL
ncbi:MAG: hypothetical protein L0170_19240, partial [Acidobacteria bacterium]|nr:hypothetical protein [Acidobacteriota bacterium]